MSTTDKLDPPLLAAWVVSLTATLGALFLGEVMGRDPCVLCWYQRILMFPLPVVLGLGLWFADTNTGRYGLALGLIGGGVAAWHLVLYWGLLPEAPQPCSATGPSCSGEAQKITGVPIALMSFIAFGLIAALSFVSLRNKTT